MSVKDTDKGMQKIIGNFAKTNGMVVAIGHFSDSGKTKDGEIALAELMATHEFGSKKRNIPARPVYQTTFHDYAIKIHKTIAKLWAMALAGKISPYVAAKRIGLLYEGLLKEQFTKRRFARLSPNYKKRPSGAAVTPDSTPLVDTATLRNAIKSKVQYGSTTFVDAMFNAKGGK